MFYEKFLKVRNHLIHFLDNNINSTNLIVIFPPGIQDARFVKELNLVTNARVICLTFPSRYKSSVLSDSNSIEKIAEFCSIFLNIYSRKYKIKQMKLVGFSFGSAVVTRIVEKYSISNIEKIVFVNPGEFFNENVKCILKILFSPALKNHFYAKVLKFILTKLLRVFNPEYFPDDRLFKINSQWISTLDYRISDGKNIQLPTTIFIGNNDKIINYESIDKIIRKFKNLSTIQYSGKHILSYSNSQEYSNIKNQLNAELEF